MYNIWLIFVKEFCIVSNHFIVLTLLGGVNLPGWCHLNLANAFLVAMVRLYFFKVKNKYANCIQINKTQIDGQIVLKLE